MMASLASGEPVEPVPAVVGGAASASRTKGDQNKNEHENEIACSDPLTEHSRANEIENAERRSRGEYRDPGGNMGSSADSRARRAGGDGDTESSADESTNIMRRSSRNNMSYQATSTSPQRLKSAAAAGVKNGGGVKKRGSRREEENEEDEAAEHQGWWAQVLSKYGSIELENKGSVARDHLALERTFLAWLRTSLAFASIGIAITQLFRLNVSSSSSADSDRYARLRSMGKPLGATFLGISIVMLFIGFHRYFESQHWIIRGKFPASRGSIVIVALVTFALMVTSLVVVVVVEPGAREKR